MPHIRSEKAFSEKLKNFFRVGKSQGFPRPEEDELELSSEVISELGQEQPVFSRLKAIRELQGQVIENKLQKHGVELLWWKVSDLLDVSQERDTRHQVFDFLNDLIIGQYTNLDMMRPSFFRFLRKHTVAEDLSQRVTILAALTDTGKDIVHIEEQVGPFLLVLLDLVAAVEDEEAARKQVLALLSNMVRYNSAYLDQDVVVGIICRLANLAVTSPKDPEILACLDILKGVVMYSYVPPEALVTFISCLCRVVNLAKLSSEAWDTTRKLLGTHLGHSALYNLCQIVQNTSNHSDTALVRGAVFFIGRSLWGPRRIPSLRYSAMAVLPFFLVALDCPHQLVLFEVSVQLKELVEGQCESLTAPEWEEAVTVLECLVSRLDRCTNMKEAVHTHLQTTMSQLEALAMTERYAGSRSRLYGLVESVSYLCTEESVLHLLSYMHATLLHPAREGWLDRLAGVVDRFYTQEERRGIRLRTLDVLGKVVIANLMEHEDRLIEQCVLPHLGQVDLEMDRTVKVEAVQTISLMASKVSGPRLEDLLNILDRICRSFSDEFRSPSSEVPVMFTREEFDYHKAAVLGVIRCLKVNFHVCGPLSKRCYFILVNILDSLYERPNVMEHTGDVRLEILRTLMALRANNHYNLGLPREEAGGEYRFSPVVVCERRGGEEVPGLTVISLTKACLAVIKCLKQEIDWRVLSHVFQQLPSTLQNKGMITRYGKQISNFAAVLVELFSPGYSLPTQHLPPKFGLPDFMNAVYPVLAALASYNRSLEIGLQKKLIKCFEYGLLASKCNQVCIVALTACILQMSGSMYSLLPEVLLNLSKISATVHIAIPVLEFLSTLINLPKVFASFRSEEFLMVFAITLPYTNPFKFNHYTVSLAHHVIIMWFLKCRLVHRKEFVKFIIRGLGSNVLLPFDEGNFRKTEDRESLSSLNQDSSNRPRSSSLKEDTPKSRIRHMTGIPSRPAAHKVTGPDERQALLTFHQELTETCVDIMARYTFSNCGVQPRRGPVANQLLSQGTSCSWLVGSKIITITVSGCGQSSTRAGLCESCLSLCQAQEPDLEADTGKKRHQSEQSSRVKRAGGGREGGRLDTEEIQPLVTEPDIGETQDGDRREAARMCGCWCSGWCEVLVRRPSGVTSWVARIQNGLLSNQPQTENEVSLRDITDLLRPALSSNSKTKVHRANSNPEIETRELPSRLELDLAHGHSCVPILEDDEELGAQGRVRASTVSVTMGREGREGTKSVFPQERERYSWSTYSPEFVFLQLYQAAGLATSDTEKPHKLPQSRTIESSLRNLDRMFCYETHKVGVLYVGLGQEDDERAILSNQFGSARYSHFLSGLGSLVDITVTDPSTVYMGGLDPRDDGHFAYIWQDQAMQVVYHTATLMPNKETDPQFNKKKRHIGNDYVAIVYNESGHPYTMGTVKGQFIYAVIVVEPLDFQSNRVSVVAKEELKETLGHRPASRIVSDQNLARLTRQIALHCGLAAVIFDNAKRSKIDPYASNWLERLRHIKRLKAKVLKEKQEEESSGQLLDFTGYM